MPFIPHTTADIEEMLKTIGVNDVNELFDEIPHKMQSHELSYIPEQISEMELLRLAEAKALKNITPALFIGAGSYDHHIPSAIEDIAARGEYLTSYTPYQAEASQGSLQLIYEFQTMLCALTKMQLSNASLYDGASALAEAIFMAIRINKHKKNSAILVPESLNPFYLQTIKTLVTPQNIEIITHPFDKETGTISIESLHKYGDKDISALVIAFPNFFGCLEPVDELVTWAKKNNIITIASVNPIALGLLKPPGLWGDSGVDIVCGEGQPLGVALSYGGPYFGFFATQMQYVRQMPGRIVGRTTDSENNIGYTLTLQAREQHIRRSKATSNICTNQGLLVTKAAIYLCLMGANGIKNVAALSHHNTLELVEKLLTLKGVRRMFSAPFFHEVLLGFEVSVDKILSELLKHNIIGGYKPTQYTSLDNTLLISATEKRTQNEIEKYFEVVRNVIETG